MIGYEDYNALGLPTEYAMQDRIEQMENCGSTFLRLENFSSKRAATSNKMRNICQKLVAATK